MNRRRARRAALVVALLALSAGFWRVREPAHHMPPVSGATDAATPRRAATLAEAPPDAIQIAPPAAATTVIPAPAPLALPPADAPLSEVLDELERRAGNGDARAACRLALDGSFCRANRLDADSVAFFEDSIARRPRTTAQDVAWIAQLEAQHARAVRICSGLPARWAEDNSWRYVLQSALAGDDTLAAMFAVAPPMSRADFLERPEPWAAYRAHALPLLQRAAAHGEVHAIWMLQRALRGATGLEGMPSALPPDPHRAAVYAVALSRVTAGASLREVQESMAAARAALGAQAWAEVEREGLAFARTHFAGQAPRDFQQGIFRDVDTRRCEAVIAP